MSNDDKLTELLAKIMDGKGSFVIGYYDHESQTEHLQCHGGLSTRLGLVRLLTDFTDEEIFSSIQGGSDED